MPFNVSKLWVPSQNFLLVFCLAVAYALLPSFSVAAEKASDKLSIYTVNYPLQYFAERIAADHAIVTFPAPAEGDPAYWTPDKKTISAYQNADLILLNGAHYAKWLEKVTLPASKMVNTSRKFKDQYITSKEAITHSHGSDGEHAHEDAAFTIWLDITLAVKQAQAIEKALSRKKPELKEVFQENYAALEKDLMDLDKELREIAANQKSLPLVVSHGGLAIGESFCIPDRIHRLFD